MEVISRVAPEEAFRHVSDELNEVALRTLFTQGIPAELDGIPQELGHIPKGSSRAPLLVPSGGLSESLTTNPVQEHLDSGGPYSLFRGTTITGSHQIMMQSDAIRVHYHATSPFGLNVQALEQLCKDHTDVSMALFGKEMQFYAEEAEVMVARDIPGCNIKSVSYNNETVERRDPANSPPLEQLDFYDIGADLMQELAKKGCCPPYPGHR